MKYRVVVFAAATMFSAHAGIAADLMSPQIVTDDTMPLRGSIDILTANNQVTVSFVENSRFYMETDSSGGRLDSERGWLPGVEVSGSLMQNWVVDNFYLYGQFKWVNSPTTYTGSYIGGTYGDIMQHDGATVVGADFRIGEGFAAWDRAMVTPYAGLGFRNWTRTVNGTGGLREDYRHGYAGAGLMVQYAPADHLVVGVNGLIGGTFAAEMETSLLTGGAVIPVGKYKLGSRAIYMAGANIDYAFANNVHVSTGVDYVGYGYGRSPQDAYGIYEPDSTTHDVTIKVGLGYSF
ncbi:MAG: hypothetical protein GX458_16790 [Phyllobacteriaceae bacterium]|nr:hypothetical protein [Phyllobacteriaceae bacterium]